MPTTALETVEVPAFHDGVELVVLAETDTTRVLAYLHVTYYNPTNWMGVPLICLVYNKMLKEEELELLYRHLNSCDETLEKAS